MAQMEYFSRSRLAGNNVPRQTYATLRGSVRRLDPDGVSAFPYFKNLPNPADLEINIDGFSQVVTLPSSGVFQDIITALTDAFARPAPAGPVARALDMDGVLAIQSATKGPAGSVEVVGGTAAEALGFDVGISRPRAQGGDVVGAPEARVGNAHSVTFPARGEDLSTTSFVRSLARVAGNTDVLHADIAKHLPKMTLLGEASHTPITTSSSLVDVTGSEVYIGVGHLSRASTPEELANYFILIDPNTGLPSPSRVVGVVVGSVTTDPPPGGYADAATPNDTGNVLGVNLPKYGPLPITAIKEGCVAVVDLNGSDVSSGDIVRIDGDDASINSLPWDHRGTRWVVEEYNITEMLLRPLSRREQDLYGFWSDERQPVLELNGEKQASQSFGTVTGYAGTYIYGTKLVVQPPLPPGSVVRVWAGTRSSLRKNYPQDVLLSPERQTLVHRTDPTFNALLSHPDITSTDTNVAVGPFLVRWHGTVRSLPASSWPLQEGQAIFWSEDDCLVHQGTISDRCHLLAQIEGGLRVCSRVEAGASRAVTVGANGQYQNLEQALYALCQNLDYSNNIADILILEDQTAPAGGWQVADSGFRIRGANESVSLLTSDGSPGALFQTNTERSKTLHFENITLQIPNEIDLTPYLAGDYTLSKCMVDGTRKDLDDQLGLRLGRSSPGVFISNSGLTTEISGSLDVLENVAVTGSADFASTLQVSGNTTVLSHLYADGGAFSMQDGILSLGSPVKFIFNGTTGASMFAGGLASIGADGSANFIGGQFQVGAGGDVRFNQGYLTVDSLGQIQQMTSAIVRTKFFTGGSALFASGAFTIAADGTFAAKGGAFNVDYEAGLTVLGGLASLTSATGFRMLPTVGSTTPGAIISLSGAGALLSNQLRFSGTGTSAYLSLYNSAATGTAAIRLTADGSAAFGTTGLLIGTDGSLTGTAAWTTTGAISSTGNITTGALGVIRAGGSAYAELSGPAGQDGQLLLKSNLAATSILTYTKLNQLIGGSSADAMHTHPIITTNILAGTNTWTGSNTYNTGVSFGAGVTLTSAGGVISGNTNAALTATAGALTFTVGAPTGTDAPGTYNIARQLFFVANGRYQYAMHNHLVGGVEYVTHQFTGRGGAARTYPILMVSPDSTAMGSSVPIFTVGTVMGSLSNFAFSVADDGTAVRDSLTVGGGVTVTGKATTAATVDTDTDTTLTTKAYIEKFALVAASRAALKTGLLLTPFTAGTYTPIKAAVDIGNTTDSNLTLFSMTPGVGNNSPRWTMYNSDLLINATTATTDTGSVGIGGPIYDAVVLSSDRYVVVGGGPNGTMILTCIAGVWANRQNLQGGTYLYNAVASSRTTPDTTGTLVATVGAQGWCSASSDSGVTWTYNGDGTGNNVVTGNTEVVTLSDIVYDPAHNCFVAVGTGASGGWAVRLTKSGSVWTFAYSKLPGTVVGGGAHCVGYSDGVLLIIGKPASSLATCWKSTDGGASWTAVTGVGAGYMLSTPFGGVQSRVLGIPDIGAFVSFPSSGSYMAYSISYDNGASWEFVPLVPQNLDFAATEFSAAIKTAWTWRRPRWSYTWRRFYIPVDCSSGASLQSYLYMSNAF